MTLEQSDKLSNLESLWFLEVGEKSFVVAMDLGVFVKLTVDELLDEQLEFINRLLFIFGAQFIPEVNVSGIFKDELEGFKEFGSLSPFHGDLSLVELVWTMEQLVVSCIDRNDGQFHFGSLGTMVGGHGQLEGDCCEVIHLKVSLEWDG